MAEGSGNIYLLHFKFRKDFNMRKLNSLVAKTALATLLMASLVFLADLNKIAYAEDEPELINLPGSFSGSFGIFTDYKFRGITQTDEEMAVQGNFDWSHEKGYYFGVWGSNVDFGAKGQGNTEFDIYAGVAREYYGITFDIGGIWYTYPGATDNLNLDFFEYKFGMSYEFPLIAVGTSINYTPQNTAGSEDATYVSFDAEVPLVSRLVMSGHVGHQWITDETAFGKPDYVDWSIGAGYSTHGFDLSVAYVDTDLNSTECSEDCDGQVIFGISRSF